MNLLAAFLTQVAQCPTRIALHAHNNAISYTDLAQLAAQLAAHWQDAGVRSGDRVLCVLPLGIPLYGALLALLRLGAVAVFPPAGAGLAGVRACARRIQPQGLLLATRFQGWLAAGLPELRAIPHYLTPKPHLSTHTLPPVVDLPATAPAVISFTSGSTGRPKAVARSHGFLWAQHQQLHPVLQPVPGAVELNALPMFILSNLASGMTSVLTRPDASGAILADLLRRYAVTRLLLPPAACQRLLGQHPVPTPVLTQIATGGGPVYPELLQALARFAPQARLTAIYGASEAEPIAHLDQTAISAADFAAMWAGAGLLAGQLAPGTQLRLVDNEIWVAGPQVVRHYLDAEDEASTKVVADGLIWHRTGDAGCLDAQDRLWLWGRHSAGWRGIYPFQVELPARQWPGVRKAAWVTVQGQGVLALEGQRGPLPAWNQPGRIVWVQHIPMDARHGSKVDYPRLQQQLRHSL